MKKLNEKQEIFCREYLIDLNATQAAIRAGYSEKTAEQMGYQLLQKTSVSSKIHKLMNDRSERLDINADYVLKRLVDIDQMDVLDILTDSGGLKHVKDWPKIWRTTLNSIDITAIRVEGNEALLKKIKWPDKLRNLELLGKHIKIQAFRDNTNTTVNDRTIKDDNTPPNFNEMTPEQAAEAYKKLMG